MAKSKIENAFEKRDRISEALNKALEDGGAGLPVDG